MKFSVTQEHINKGKRLNPICCPVVLCVREALSKKERDVLASRYNICVLSHGRFIDYRCPSSVEEFIDKYDKNESVEPFSFELELK